MGHYFNISIFSNYLRGITMESTQQYQSRVDNDNSAATNQRLHIDEVKAGKSSYKINLNGKNRYLVFENSDLGQRCGSASTILEAIEMIEAWQK